MRIKAQKIIVSVKCPKCNPKYPQLATAEHASIWLDTSTTQIIADVNCPSCGEIVEVILFSY